MPSFLTNPFHRPGLPINNKQNPQYIFTNVIIGRLIFTRPLFFYLPFGKILPFFFEDLMR